MRNVSDKSCRENQDTFENRAVYNILWRSIVEPGNMAHAHCMLDT